MQSIMKSHAEKNLSDTENMNLVTLQESKLLN